MEHTPSPDETPANGAHGAHNVATPRLTPLSLDQEVAHAIRNRLTLIVGTGALLTRLAARRTAAGESLDPADVTRRLARLEEAAWEIDVLLDHWVSGAEGRPERTGQTTAS